MAAFTGEPNLNQTEQTMNLLNNNIASGSDELPGELLNHGLNIHAKPIAHMFNRDLPKPGKPVGALTHLKPIVLIN